MSPILMALLIGVIAGLRTVTAPAAVSWAARLGWLDLAAGWANFLAAPATSIGVAAFALLEYVADLMPRTPSRRVPVQFAARVVSGGFCGAAIGGAGEANGAALVMGLLAGASGAVAGTLGGSALRARAARALGRDWPAALAEDAVAIAGACLILTSR